MIVVTPLIALAEGEIEERFIRSPGPGGQNVNKVETAVQLRFDAEASPNLPDDVKAQLRALAGQRMTKEGVVVITARRFRSQDRNRADALDRLVALIAAAAERPRKRKPTRPTLASKRHRVEAKKQKGAVKKLRGRVGEVD